MLENNHFYLGDCLQLLPQVTNASVDLLLCDLPYGTTASSWDTVLPLDILWKEYLRIVKPHGAIVLTASQPFASVLVSSQLPLFRHEWIWEKHQGTAPMLAKVAPMKAHESILVFGQNKVNYYPQMTVGRPYGGFSSNKTQSKVYGGRKSQHRENPTGLRYPKSVLYFSKDPGKRIHPNQKPVALFEYLINTYSQPGDVILDHCAGSGTTALAADNLGRIWILIEKDAQYYQDALARINSNRQRLQLSLIGSN